MFKIIAETAFSHEGDFSYLLQQIDIAAKGKADYIKFQVLINREEYIVQEHPAFDVLDKWMFDNKQWFEAFDYAKQKGLKILALPLNISSLELCLGYQGEIDFYEIHSVCFKDQILINRLKSIDKKIIIGIGGRTGKETEAIIEDLDIKKSDLILMSGFQSFPTIKSDLNLMKINAFKTQFGIPMGFADHSSYENDDFIEMSALAMALGAIYFEKHIVIDKGQKRIDFESAISASELIRLRTKLQETFEVLGAENLNALNSKELAYKAREKQKVYKQDYNIGEQIQEGHLVFKITEDSSDDVENIISRVLKANVKKNQTIKKAHFQ